MTAEKSVLYKVTDLGVVKIYPESDSQYSFLLESGMHFETKEEAMMYCISLLSARVKDLENEASKL
jgi:hypothetical protein